MNQAYLGKMYWRLTGLVMLVMLLVLGGLSFFTQSAFEQRLLPDLVQKAVTVGASTRSLILRAVDYGIDYSNLYGVSSTFAELRKENPEFAYIAATNERGVVLFESGERAPGADQYYSQIALSTPTDASATPVLLGAQYVVSLPLMIDDKALGMLHFGIDQAYIKGVMREVLLDVLVVLLVSVFFTFELLHFVVGNKLEAQFGALAETVDFLGSGNFVHASRSSADARKAADYGLVTGELALSQKIDAALSRLFERYRELALRVSAAAKQGSTLSQQIDTMFSALSGKYRFAPEDSAFLPSAIEAPYLERIRTPLFVFLLAEELTRSFVPGYANYLLVDVPFWAKQIVIGLPIVLFMAIVALAQPYLGPWSYRIGRKNAMLIGAVLATVGFMGTALAGDLYALLFWRSLCALGYAMVFVAAQGYVLDHTGEHNRARGFALFVGVFMVATICGPPIGGILADNIGYRWSFLVSGLVALVSIAIIMGLPQERQSDGLRELPLSFADFKRLIKNQRFTSLSLFAAIPAKIILTGFCFYLIPLYILSLGNSPAMAGRLLMAYAVIMVLVVPLAARFADLNIRRERLVALGLCVSALGGFLMPFFDSIWALFVLVVLLGFGQSLSIAAQGALVSDFCRSEECNLGEGAVYGAYRLLERTGNVLGPLLASIFLVLFGYGYTFALISLLVLLASLVFALASGVFRAPRSPEKVEA
ncbi:MAG: MFS transporter [Pseudomonadota bacterium]